MRRARVVAPTLFVLLAALLAPAQSVAADPQLTVRVTGAGHVTSSPAGIDCPGDCAQAYPLSRTGAPQTVQLTATPDAGQVLQGWGQACSGNGPCAVVMNTSKVVSAAFAAAPAPTPEPTGFVTVEPTAGGSVAGLAGTIACPPDCTEPRPLGSAFDLAATAHSGFAFDHWEGACTGPGGCSGTVVPATFVRAVFTAAPPATRPATQDSDGDGVPDATDACPDTAKGVRAGRDGCAAPDVVRAAGGTLDPLRARLTLARAGLRFVPAVQGVLRQLTAIGKLLDRGQALVESGDACGAAGRLKSAASQLRKAGASSATLIANLQKSVFATRLPAGFGDTSEKDMQVLELNYRKRLLDAAIAAGTGASQSFGATCKAFAKKTVVRGVVKTTDDETGLVTLTDGRRVLLPVRGGFGDAPAEGRAAVITGKGAGGKSPVLADSVVVAGSSQAPNLQVIPCMKLRIAPVQDFSEPSPVLHDPAGYRSGGVLRLEGGMRVAASPKCAAGKGRYSLAIDVIQGNNTWNVTSDLDASDPPAELPVSSSNKELILRVHERRQLSNCPPPGPTPNGRAAKSFPCPVVEQSVTDHKFRIRGRGSYGTAVYSATKFALDVDAPQFVTVTGLAGKDATLPATATFEGEGYNTIATVNTGNYVTLVQGQQWTLYPKQLYGFTSDVLFPLDTLGVDHFAGVLWPRIVGKRGGKPFRYSAKLPTIITDVLAFCPDQGEDCYYAPPWAFLDARGVNQGNGPMAFSHNGAQQYAFDFDFADGDEILATRGGVVGDAVENLNQNYNPCDPATPNADGLGNYVRIDHQDGTYSYYVHLKTNTVPLTVGDEIGRGATIGQADNTGRSCGPHLHYQTSVVKNQLYYGQTTEILFDTWVQGQASPYSQPCYLPKSGDVLISTNG
jgi:murein DD-endopeptidase MepM/ murein hydrolase activator NlpD